VHPDDVAEYVLSEVEELRRTIAETPQLNVLEVKLEDRTELFLRFRKVDHARIEAITVPGLIAPNQQPIGIPTAAIDLSQKSERELVLQMNCEDLDGVPPTAELRQEDLTPLSPEEWPQGLTREGMAQGHPEYQRPFFCRRGLREYHSHPGHQDDPWDKYRESVSLHVIAIELLGELQSRWTMRS
jgi:hypothetical protein